jgi:hypothetical protein
MGHLSYTAFDCMSVPPTFTEFCDYSYVTLHFIFCHRLTWIFIVWCCSCRTWDSVVLFLCNRIFFEKSIFTRNSILAWDLKVCDCVCSSLQLDSIQSQLILSTYSHYFPMIYFNIFQFMCRWSPKWSYLLRFCNQNTTVLHPPCVLCYHPSHFHMRSNR